jgi:D-glycero-beta-D-manno-heptose-7-phosphate kinase
MNDFQSIFKSFANIKVGVIGDVMLDTYMWGKVERISPEAPVPVVSLSKKDYRIGGAANVGLNLVSLQAHVTMLSVLGNDADGQLLTQMLQQNKIETKYLVHSKYRMTTNKTRIISRNQQMMRLDNETTEDVDNDEANQLLVNLAVYIEREKPQVIIFEDYNKGVLTENFIEKAILLCKRNNIITTVDPKRKNFFAYKSVDLFKPNLKEVLEGLNIVDDEVNIANMQTIHSLLKDKLNHQISLITLSEHGVFFQEGTSGKILPAHLRKIADVSGAGDTVIAVASLVYAATKNVELMTEMANIAGGLVCEQVGTAAIDPQLLMEECEKIMN